MDAGVAVIGQQLVGGPIQGELSIGDAAAQ